MKKENKIILLVCITIVINCLIVIFFSTEIRKRLEVTTDQSEKMVQEVDKKNAAKSEDSKNEDKNSSQDKESEEDKVTDKENEKETSKKADNETVKGIDKETDKDTDESSINNNSEVSTNPNKNQDQNTTNTKNNDTTYPDLQSKMNTLEVINKDVVGYIWIEDTNISYPVLQEDTNEYYLHRDIDHKYSATGSVVLDSALDKDKVGSLENALIIGNNISDGTMFADLIRYKEEDFFKEHSYIYYQDKERLTKWKVFSVYYINGDVEEIPTIFKDNSSFNEYLLKIKKRSLYESEIQLNKEDRILTLMTDSFEYANGKTILHAVLDEIME